ncbi:MAG: hypothetical protein ACUVRK_11690 [Spirochaetota bacterium]
MATKPLIVIKSRVNSLKWNITGLALIVIDNTNNKIMGVNSVFISGDALKNARTNLPPIDFIQSINVAKEQYTVQKEFSNLLSTYFMNKLQNPVIVSLVNNIQNNQISAVNEVQKLVKNALSIDTIDVYTEFDSISNTQYNEIIVAQKIESLTLSQQVELIATYYDNDTQLAEQTIKNGKQDIGIAVIYYYTKEFYGVCFCFINCITKKILYVFNWIDEQNIIQSQMANSDALYESFFMVAKNSQRISKFTPIMHELQSFVWNVDVDALINAISHQASALAAQLFAKVFKKYNGMQMRVELYTIDALTFHLLYNPSQYDKPAEEKDDTTKISKKLVDVEFVLSPTSGKTISQLKQDDYIYVLIDTSTPYGYDIAKALNLIVDNKNTPIEAKVYSVNYSKKDGFKVFVKITESLYGKAIEEQDVKVKMKLSTNVDKNETSSKVSLVIGLIAGLIVIAILLCILLV